MRIVWDDIPGNTKDKLLFNLSEGIHAMNIVELKNVFYGLDLCRLRYSSLPDEFKQKIFQGILNNPYLLSFHEDLYRYLIPYLKSKGLSFSASVATGGSSSSSGGASAGSGTAGAGTTATGEKKTASNSKEDIMLKLNNSLKELENRASSLSTSTSSSQKEALNNVIKVIKEEIEILDLLEKKSPDFHLNLNYINWLLVHIPWNIFSKDNLSLLHARQTLDEDHYGMDDVKKIILEFIASSKLKNNVMTGRCPLSLSLSLFLSRLPIFLSLLSIYLSVSLSYPSCRRQDSVSGGAARYW
jgi:hypothetical protein